jgi:hypothetical protein
MRRSIHAESSHMQSSRSIAMRRCFRRDGNPSVAPHVLS